MSVVILADDLSGAADCAAASRKEAIVTMDWSSSDVAAAITSVDLNSRGLNSDAAADLAGAVVRALAKSDTTLVYQKMDSTLRGNWPAELAAIRNALSQARGVPHLAVLAQAFPERGRTTLAGGVFVDGQPLAKSEALAFSTDGHRELDMVTRLGRADIASMSIANGLSACAIRQQMQLAIERGCAAVVCDALSRADLDAIALAGLEMDGPLFFVGSAGLMGSLARAAETFGARRGLEPISVNGSVLVAVGSASRVSQEQFDILAAQPFVEGVVLLMHHLESPQFLAEANARIVAALADKRDIAVAIRDEPASVENAAHGGFSAALAHFLAPHLPYARGLVLTGGETARAVLERAGVNAIQLLGEIGIGIPVGRTIGATSVPLVIKAGAFGGPGDLVHAVNALRGRSDNPTTVGDYAP